MNLYQFLPADEMEQIEAFWKGVLVGERMEGECKIICKQIDGFYVEYKLQGTSYIDMRAFKNPDLLLSYLEKIQINVKLL